MTTNVLYRYQQVIGTLVVFEVNTTKSKVDDVKNIIENAIKYGMIGRYQVSHQGFQYTIINGAHLINFIIITIILQKNYFFTVTLLITYVSPTAV